MKRRLSKWLLALAAVSAMAVGFDLTRASRATSFAYLTAFAFVASTVLGGLLLVMIAHAAGASWFFVMRRLGEAIASPAPLMPLAFLPIAVGLRELYPWARPLSGLDESIRASILHSEAWMNPKLFLARTSVYLLVWIGFAESIRRASVAEDRGASERAAVRQRQLSAIGLPVIAFTGSFAAFDWFMSAVPGWNFNIFGLYLLTGGFASAMGVLAAALHHARRTALLPPQVGPHHISAIGRLLLTSVCLWSYLAAVQLVIVWSANVPREASFLLERYTGLFRFISLGLLLGHFALPFLLLLLRGVRRNSGAVAALGIWIVLMHGLDCYWLLMPASPRSASAWNLAPWGLLVPLALAFGTWRFSRLPAVPTGTSQLERSLAYEAS